MVQIDLSLTVPYEPAEHHALVQVLAISCALTDPQDIAWWQPYATSTSEHTASTAEQPWLPWAVQITVDNDERKVSVAEGSSAAELQMQDSSTPRQQARIRWAVRSSKVKQSRARQVQHTCC